MASASELASAWVTIYPRFAKNFNSTVSRTVNKAVGGVTNSISSTGNSLGRKLGNGIVSGLSTTKVAIGNVIASGVTAALGQVTASIDGAVSRVDTMENFPKMMVTWGESSEAAYGSIQRITDGVEGLPTKVNDLTAGVNRLYTVVNDLDVATDLGIGLNDMMLSNAASTELANNAFEQFAQMMAAGKVDMMAWRSVINAAPKALDQLAKSLLGAEASAMDLYDALPGSKAYPSAPIKLTFDEVAQAIIKLDKEGGDGIASFADQARSASVGIATSMKNVKTAIEKNLANTMKSIGRDRIAGYFDTIKGKINEFGAWFIEAKVPKINEWLDKWNFEEAIDRMQSRVTRGIQWLNANVVPPVKSIFDSIGRITKTTRESLAAHGGSFGGLFTKVLGSASSGLANMVPRIEGFIKRLVDKLALAADKITRRWDAVVKHIQSRVTRGIQWLNVNVVPPVKSIFDSIGGIIETTIESLAEHGGSFGGLFAKVLGSASSGLANMVPRIEVSIERLVDNLAWAADQITLRWDAVVERIKPVARALGQIFENTVAGVTGAFEGKGIDAAASRVFDGISALIVRTTNLAGILAIHLAEFVSSLNLQDVDLAGGVNKFFDVVQMGITWIAQHVGPVLKRIADALAPFIDKLATDFNAFLNDDRALVSFSTTLSKVLNGVGDIIISIIKFVNEHWDDIKEIGIHLGKIVADVIEYLVKHGPELKSIAEDLLDIVKKLVTFMDEHSDVLVPLVTDAILLKVLIAPLFKAAVGGLKAVKSAVTSVGGAIKGIQKGGLKGWWKDLFGKGAADAVKAPASAIETFADKYYKDKAGRWHSMDGKFVKTSVVEAEIAAAQKAEGVVAEAAETATKAVSESATRASTAMAETSAEAAKVVTESAAMSEEAVANSSSWFERLKTSASEAIHGMRGSSAVELTETAGEAMTSTAQTAARATATVSEVAAESEYGIARVAETAADSVEGIGVEGKMAAAEIEGVAAATEGITEGANGSVPIFETLIGKAKGLLKVVGKVAKVLGPVAIVVDTLMTLEESGMLQDIWEMTPWGAEERKQNQAAGFASFDDIMESFLATYSDNGAFSGLDDEEGFIYTILEDRRRAYELGDRVITQDVLEQNIRWLAAQGFTVRMDGQRVAELQLMNNSRAEGSLTLYDERGLAY